MAQRSKRALITGITGQDGSYLAEYLLGLGYHVAGFVRSSSTGYLGNVKHLKEEITFYRGSLDDAKSIEAAIYDFDPDEIYNLAAEAAPYDSFFRRVYTCDINALGPLRVFEAAARLNERGRNVRVYQASTSEMFGAAPAPQSEASIMRPNNPYGVAKLFAHNQARIYRESTKPVYISCGILFNHESPRRGMQYVTRKITVAVACIKNRVKNSPLSELGEPIVSKDWKLKLGTLDARRDWGYAPDYVRAMHRMLQMPDAGEYVIATGETHTIEEFVSKAFSSVGLDWRDHVESVPQLVRPLETPYLQGDATVAREVLGWQPSITFDELVKLMVDSDLALFS